ncbi:MAG: polysaccharide pyruvyl transferase family protein [Ruminococcus flavefaciens]|nr:polysaccharide pyruvyl transferase family protein [Ruminococcus flavefaciens]
MKYARLIYGYNKKQLTSMQYINLGDYFQTFAIDNLFCQAGIVSDDIRNIEKAKLQYYNDSPICLPMQGWFGHIKGTEIFPLPPMVKPIFIGYHSLSKSYYSQKCINTYQKYSPICCRDEGTYQRMKRYGIDAYLTGCLTITLPERKSVPSKTKVFLVDAPNNIEKFMPQELKENISYITHEIPYNYNNSEEYELERIEILAKELLKKYEQEATLVVTSRLHCAAPCIGLGIPVILARKYFDDRYAWIDKYLPLYTPNNFEHINWYPDKIDLSKIKPLLIDLFTALILPSETENLTTILQEIHDFYMDRERALISTPFYVKLYFKLHEIFPRFTDYMREVILKDYTVATARNKSDI